MRISDWSSDVCSSDLLTYFTHYTDSYSNPTNPYLDAVGHQIGLYSDGSFARLNVFSTDNNLQLKFSTGPAIEHTVLFGLDYSWNNVRKRGGFGYEVVDLYGIDYTALPIPDRSEENQSKL